MRETFPPPASMSPQAKAWLTADVPGARPYPPLDDAQAWREQNATINEGLVQRFAPLVANAKATVVERTIGGVPCYDLTPLDLPAERSRLLLFDIHGGGLVIGYGEACKGMALMSMQRAFAHTISVDYRMPPDHPYPAALDDCLSVYVALLRDHRPEDIVVTGASAGGNLAAALMLRARDEGVPLPAGAILLTPEVDLTESGDSFQTLLGIDNVLPRSLMPANLLYANGVDLRDPYLSPLFGDFSKGYPPTLIQAGTRDLFLSNAVRMHRALRAANLPSELHVFEAMPHGGFGGSPEDAEVAAEVRKFADKRWGVS